MICVTHLPQIAAFADAHLRIEKAERDGRTVTDITPLDDRERGATSWPRCSAATPSPDATRAAADALLRAGRVAHRVAEPV